MFDSLQKLTDYPDFLQVWPGHGAGSACGKSLGAVPLSTLGYERQNNWVFKYNDKDAFVKELTNEQPEPPSYFAQMKKVNKEGLPEFKLREIKIDAEAELIGQVFDLRSKEAFKEGFIKGSINIPYNDKFLQFAGWYINYDEPMTVIADSDNSEQLQKDLASIGYDKLQLIVPEDKIDRYVDSSYTNISPEDFVKDYENKNVLDVRSLSEYNSGHLDNAEHIHFGQLDEKEIPFNKEDEIYVHCQSGVRSAIAMSVLKARGFDNIVNVEKGYSGIKANLN